MFRVELQLDPLKADCQTRLQEQRHRGTLDHHRKVRALVLVDKLVDPTDAVAHGAWAELSPPVLLQCSRESPACAVPATELEPL